VTFVIHLMQCGRLTDDEKQSAKPRGGLARWRFEDGSAMLLSEYGREHKAGIWVMSGDLETQEPLAGLGPEADGLSADELGRVLQARSARVHTALRDQRVVAGLGRRLANEICHRAKISPFASTKKLTVDEIERLHQAISDAIADSMDYEATQTQMTKSAQRPSRVHHRTGEPCPECGDAIRAVEYTSYTVNYCPTCQTGGKILADNTTSKFLR
jgi:formamidopyrimidine-DNA glycosylase